MITDFEQALNIVLFNCGIEGTADNTFLIAERGTWLQTMTGRTNTLPSITSYRPYYVTGWHYWLLPENNLISGEGAKFDQNFEVCRRYLQMQLTQDNADNLIVDEAYSAKNLLGQLDRACQDCSAITKNPTISIMGF